MGHWKINGISMIYFSWAHSYPNFLLFIRFCYQSCNQTFCIAQLKITSKNVYHRDIVSFLNLILQMLFCNQTKVKVQFKCHGNNKNKHIFITLYNCILYYISGQCLNFNCMFILVLMLRQCITFLRTHGFSMVLPLDQHIYFHKLAGVFIFIQSIVHTIMHLLNFSELQYTVYFSCKSIK